MGDNQPPPNFDRSINLNLILFFHLCNWISKKDKNWFGPVSYDLILLDPMLCLLIQLDLIWTDMFQLIWFEPVYPIWSSLVQFGPINLIKSTLIWFETWNNQLQPGLAWHILLASFCAFYAIFNSYLFLILSVLIWLADVIVRSIMAYTYLHVLILYFGSVIWFISGAMFALYELFFPHEIRALGRSENLRGTSSISRHFQRESFAYILAKIWGEWPPYPPQFLRPW